MRLIVRAFRKGGRLFYVGAGTSGRLGVLDASECPPTFRTPREWSRASSRAGPRPCGPLEGAEDDAPAGARPSRPRRRPRDIVVGVAASGRTPFVWGALGRRGRAAPPRCCSASTRTWRVPRRQRPTVVIAPDAGPEILTGSTRLKAGTATKLVLNVLTTLRWCSWARSAT